MILLAREALYELVWTEPVRTVAARFNVSDVALKKHCARAGVPVPERGYWAKLAAGQKVRKIPLPVRDPGASNSVAIGREQHFCAYDPEAELAKPMPELPVFPEPIEVVRARVAKIVRNVRYIRDLKPLRQFTQAA
jgi:hypothetical protein